MHAILIAGAALVGLPVLLHLIMKQEPKRLSFPAFRFLTQKLKTNQRKLRLRHFILLAMRVLLIALFCLTLYQPTLKSDRLNIRGEQPVATVVVIDTSPSMGYVANERSRLDEARRRALELLDELPEKSPVAVVTTDDPQAAFWQSLPDARKTIEKLDKPRGGSQPVTSAVAQGYQLFTKVEGQDVEEGEQLPKLLAVFTDRAAASWDPARVEDLKKFREKLPDPKPAHAVFDVGADKPVNVGILAAEMRPQVISANQPASVTVTVAADGPPELPPVEAVVLAKIDDSATPERRLVVVPYGQSRAVTFEFKNQKPGAHRVEFSLEAPDKLMFDNVRFLTFKVGEARRILTISDDPGEAVFWQISHQSKGEFGCLVVKPEDVRMRDGRTLVTTRPDPEKPDATAEENISAFDVVCLLSVADPGAKPNGLDSLWDCVRPYVEGGGKLVVIPGDGAKPESYAAGGNLMPGALKGVIETKNLTPPPPKQKAPGWTADRDGANGVTWFLGGKDDRVLQHPLMQPFQEWVAKGNVDVVKFPRVARKYFDLAKAPEAAVVVRFNDAERDADRRPAVLDRSVGKGRVLMLATPLDISSGSDPGAWHDYWEVEGSSWGVVFPWLLARYLAGDTADANFNFQAGQSVTVPLPKGGVPRGVKVVVDLFGGPPLTGDLALVEVGDKQTELRLGPPRTSFAGNYVLSVDAVKWRDGFSLNAPAEESTLEKVPVEGVEDLTGKDTVLAVDKDVKLRDLIPKVTDQPVDLFPWLLILVLVLLAVEGLVANRFYRRVK